MVNIAGPTKMIAERKACGSSWLFYFESGRLFAQVCCGQGVTIECGQMEMIESGALSVILSQHQASTPRFCLQQK